MAFHRMFLPAEHFLARAFFPATQRESEWPPPT